jgi:hypothetical protein
VGDGFKEMKPLLHITACVKIEPNNVKLNPSDITEEKESSDRE